MTQEQIVTKGKQLAWLLRHDKSYEFPKNGWRDILDLIDNHGFTIDELEELVRIDDKQRYEFSDTKEFIRARQGHSVNVDVELPETIPPDKLYHGTSVETKNLILSEGIKKMSRLYVHLSPNVETAIKVGKRHGVPIIFEIDSKRMYEDGIKFYLSRNGVWLTDYVDTKYITLLD